MKHKTLAMMLFMLMSMAASVVLTSCGDDEDEVTPGGGNGKAPSGVKTVDLGLPSGTLWANMNVGANSEEAPGNSYAWGETEVKTDYSWSTYKWDNDGHLTKYKGDSSSSELEPEDDAAYVNWGSQWRMPSIEQLGELRSKCSWSWTTLNDVNGYKVVGPNGNSIFMPTTSGSYGYYWSRTLYGTLLVRGAYYLSFYSSTVGMYGDYRYDYESYRYLGHSVRPVRNQ